MNEMTTLAVKTHLFGAHAKRTAPPVYIPLTERTLTARDLIAEHVRAEVSRAQQQRESSLALHYLLAEQVQRSPEPASSSGLDVEAETRRALSGFAEKRFVLMVDGTTITGLDQPLTLTQRSNVSFVRLMPLIGG